MRRLAYTLVAVAGQDRTKLRFKQERQVRRHLAMLQAWGYDYVLVYWRGVLKWIEPFSRGAVDRDFNEFQIALWILDSKLKAWE